MRLKQIRKERNFKVQEVADYLCCLPSVYSRYENETREPSLDVLRKLSKLYDVSVDYLIENDVASDVYITKEEVEMVKAMRQADKRSCHDAVLLMRLHPANKKNIG